jgi:Zn-dependent protease with chaperone function
MKLHLVFVLLLLTLCASGALGQANPVKAQSPGPNQPTVSSVQRITAYTLPPDRYRQAHELNRLYFAYRLISFVLGIFVLLLLLYFRLAPRLRDLAERVSAKRFVQALIFTPLFVLILSLFQLPADACIHRVSTQYGLSIQSWSSWFTDWTKEQLITIVGATFLVWLLYAIVRKSPRRWWVYFWLASLPIGLSLVFIQPLVLDPMFHKFEPLAQRDPELAQVLSQMVQRAGEDIPVDRMFWMDASEKTTTLNAYVAGVGASKRIVVWDTSIKKLTTPQIVFVAGHEMGHYVLHHVVKGLLIGAIGLLLLFYVGYRASRWLISMNAERWSIRGLDDYASLPMLILVLYVTVFVATPVASAISRHYEHQADQYALEVTHGLLPDSDQVCAQAFQALGYVGLSDPDPNPLNVFLFYDHPTISERVKFCLAYEDGLKENRRSR